jgi:hypothetical protein
MGNERSVLQGEVRFTIASKNQEASVLGFLIQMYIIEQG